MQILLHSDPHADGSQLMAQHLSAVVTDAMAHFAEHITRVEAHLSEVHSQARSGTDGSHCTLEARLIGLEPVIVKDHAGSAHQAIDGALHKLKRAVESALAKHDPRQHRGRATGADESIE